MMPYHEPIRSWKIPKEDTSKQKQKKTPWLKGSYPNNPLRPRSRGDLDRKSGKSAAKRKAAKQARKVRARVAKRM